ncbi:hypothetical protein RN001_011230 [Aquatica leii]|uniref:Testin n=1 Tax=Aquatica leii TaxID=1421715 RepID=A0AAN7P7S2_9COLE|nr:hypothetical protein RN001_011230 [Aquatica leii]
MSEEKQEGPKWLKELEEKRERRLKARLGHEAGAGSPCLTCENKCPGLDLHFWRKICKNCKCGKENHDVDDDDIYGWAQFQLLGSKPNKAKKIVLPGRKDAVELEWTPKGQSEIVDTYLKELPINLLPIKGSPAAQERKQLLQKQIPLHDIDPALCHALSDHEIKQMNDYVAHVKQNSVGMGHILKLNEILKNRLVNPQYKTKRTPMQLSQSQNIILQGVDRSKDPHLSDLQKNLNELHLSRPTLINVQQNMKYPNQPFDNIQSGITGSVRDVTYPTYQRSDDIPVDDKLQYSKLINYPSRYNHEVSSIGQSHKDLQSQIPNQPYSHQIDSQQQHKVNPVKDLHAQLHTVFPDLDCSNQLYPNHPVSNTIDSQIGTKPSIKDIHARTLDNNVIYPDMNVNFKLGDLKANPELLTLTNVPNKLRTTDQQNPITSFKDLAYSTYDSHLQPHYNPSMLNVEEQNVEPLNVSVGLINDIEYPTVKIAEEMQNDFVTRDVRKKPILDFSHSDILPSCHKCNKMFDVSSLVIGIGHSEALWHVDCFKCTGCNQNLADMMYFYHKESGEIYCGRDYAKIRGIPRCQACDELIFVKEYCLAENSTFHVKHFCCFECDKPLAGQNYVMEDLQPLCVPCFEMVKAEKCRACSMVIKPDEQGANLKGVHFHANDQCFSCKTCKKALLDAKILFKNSNLYCSAPCFADDK